MYATHDVSVSWVSAARVELHLARMRRFYASDRYRAMVESDQAAAAATAAKRANVADVLAMEAVRRERAVLLREARAVARGWAERGWAPSR